MSKTPVLTTSGSHTVWEVKWFDKDAFAVESFLTTDKETKDTMVLKCEVLKWEVTVTEHVVQHWTEV